MISKTLPGFGWLTSISDKLSVLAEIIRATSRGATRAQVAEELSLSPRQAARFLRFLQGKGLIVLIKGANFYSPSERGLSFLDVYDGTMEIADSERATNISGSLADGPPKSVYWDKTEINARMREIIGR